MLSGSQIWLTQGGSNLPVLTEEELDPQGM